MATEISVDLGRETWVEEPRQMYLCNWLDCWPQTLSLRHMESWGDSFLHKIGRTRPKAVHGLLWLFSSEVSIQILIIFVLISKVMEVFRKINWKKKKWTSSFSFKFRPACVSCEPMLSYFKPYYDSFLTFLGSWSVPCGRWAKMSGQ